MLNSATADRFVPIYLEDQMDLVKLLTSMVPGADKIAIKTCATIYEKIRKAIKDGKLSLSIKEASDLMAKEVEEESFELPESGEEATTSLGALFANIKL